MEYSSNYRNRPIKSSSEYKRDEELKNKKGCHLRMGCGTAILYIAILYGVHKCNRGVQDRKVDRYETAIDRLENVIDSLEYKLEEKK